MAAAVHIAPASGSVVNTVSACEVTCTGADPNTVTGYNADNYPQEPAILYYFKLSASGEDDLISPIFTTSAAGDAEWHDVIIPAAGTWTLDLVDSADDSVAATASVTVS